MSQQFLFLFFLSLLLNSFANVLPREEYERLFFEHIQSYNIKIKDSHEFVHRLQIFADNLDSINEHNAQDSTWTQGLNRFSHLTLDEFHQQVHIGKYKTLIIHNETKGGKDVPLPSKNDILNLPRKIDWQNQGVVTDVKDQGNCGSCWSFATTGALEGAYGIKFGKLPSFSEQQLVSCDKMDFGCDGGFMDTAYQWAYSNGGLTSESNYPYTSGETGQNGQCQTGYENVPNSQPQAYWNVPSNNVDAMMQGVSVTPVAIAIDASSVAFMTYSGGILTANCGQELDHAVLIVGYGELNGIDYWKIKNSWGPSWGKNGYILVARSSANLCGLLDYGSYPSY